MKMHSVVGVDRTWTKKCLLLIYHSSALLAFEIRVTMAKGEMMLKVFAG